MSDGFPDLPLGKSKWRSADEAILDARARMEKAQMERAELIQLLAVFIHGTYAGVERHRKTNAPFIGILGEYSFPVTEELVEVFTKFVKVITDPCQTCEGPIRETVNMVCLTCGWNYMNGEKKR